MAKCFMPDEAMSWGQMSAAVMHTHIYHLHHCIWPLLVQKLPTRALHPGSASQAVPRFNPSFLFYLKIAALGVSWEASLSLSLWVPGQGLTCGTGPWHLEGLSNPC